MPKPEHRPYKPDPQECAILLILLLQAKAIESGKENTRARLSAMTLKRLWGRHRLPDDFLREVEEWMFRAGWALFYAGTTFAAVKTRSVEGWPRVSSKHLATELDKVAEDRFDFSRHYHLMLEDADDAGDED
jgi:hypothetical protein